MVEPDLLAASITMLTEVEKDAKKVDRDASYVKMLDRVLSCMKKWCEKPLLDYHSNFGRSTVGHMESILPLVLSANKILEDYIPCYVSSTQDKGQLADHPTGNMVDHYIRSSSRNAFSRMVKDATATGLKSNAARCEMLIQLAKETEELVSKEKDIFSPVLQKCHPIATGVSAVTLHACYGTLLKMHLAAISPLRNETILVLQRAGKLEKALIQMVVENSVECKDAGRVVLREMVPYDVDNIILKLLKQWIQERLKIGKENLQRAKETETWNPKSKTEPYAQSAAELITFSKEALENFFTVPGDVSETLLSDLTDGLEHLFRYYITFVASCGSKQSYLPTLPPLTRCSCDSKFLKLWRRAACSIGAEDPVHDTCDQVSDPHPSTSRGTQRLYIRLNTLHYLLSQLHYLAKMLSLSRKVQSGTRRQLGSSYFEHSRTAIQSAAQHVSEVAAYRLIFLDTNPAFYGSLYVPDVASNRLKPALEVLRQNLALLCAIVTEKAQPLALKELMKASFEGFLMVLLAGGSSRVFSRVDHPMIEEDFDCLKRLFSTCGEGFIGENEVSREGDAVEGVVALMGQTTDQLVEDFSIVACEASGIGVLGAGQRLPMPPTTGKWNRSDPNTILRVLCHRIDRVANNFLKKTFQLAKRSSTS